MLLGQALRARDQVTKKKHAVVFDLVVTSMGYPSHDPTLANEDTIFCKFE